MGITKKNSMNFKILNNKKEVEIQPYSFSTRNHSMQKTFQVISRPPQPPPKPLVALKQIFENSPQAPAKSKQPTPTEILIDISTFTPRGDQRKPVALQQYKLDKLDSSKMVSYSRILGDST
jgi:hypothetical protein